MLDDLRGDAEEFAENPDDNIFADFEAFDTLDELDQDPHVLEEQKKALKAASKRSLSADLSPIQRFVLAFMFFCLTGILSIFFLLVSGTITL